ncbi:MAG: HlyD family efflux transporter periplasmic adaptor subunit [Candidatus Kryptonium sp.]|nr:efflux RND transporter periplasmic adaptor subunit [Candidatus Kryptonium sp.]MCX7761510.1 efflux RND transporter periplasmic adaptor subunit [Candidatus Kryptonium sp.]MDW8109502.1 HlyD family efflux transporter periplasmic adaptor subunit [Candidatus Kryptonium sp.]
MRKHLFAILILPFIISCSNNKNGGIFKTSGTTEAKEVVVSSEISGKIIYINFDEGDKVDSGFVLCQIDTELTYQKYLEAKAQMEASYLQYQLLLKGARTEEIEAMEEVVNRAKVNLENAQKQFERIKSLYEDGVATQEQFDNVRAFYETSKTQYEEARKKLEALRKGAREEEIKIAFSNYNRAVALVRAIQIQLKDSKIVAPISGFVLEKFVEIGEFIPAGAPIAKIANLEEVYVRFFIPEKEIGIIKIGDSVNIKVNSYPGKIFKGKVVFISPKAEFTPKNVQTEEERAKLVYAVKVKVKNENGVFKSGMPVDVEIIKRR